MLMHTGVARRAVQFQPSLIRVGIGVVAAANRLLLLRDRLLARGGVRGRHQIAVVVDHGRLRDTILVRGGHSSA